MRFLDRKNFFNEEKNFFFFQRFVLQQLGFWPGSDCIRPWQIAFAIFNAFEILGYAVFQVNFCINNIGDLVLLLNGIAPLVTQIVMVNKILVFVWKRKDIKKVLDYLFDSFVHGSFCIIHDEVNK